MLGQVRRNRERSVLLYRQRPPQTVDERILEDNHNPLARYHGLTERQVQSFRKREEATEPPLTAYTRWFEEYLKSYPEKAKKHRNFNMVDELLDKEVEYRKQMGKGYNVQFRGAVGTGKCHRKGQRIIMYDRTLRAVEDVRVGDVLMGPDNKPRTVISLASGRSPMVEVRPTSGKPFVVTSEHVLTLVDLNERVVDVPIPEYLTWTPSKKRLHWLFRIGGSGALRTSFSINRVEGVEEYYGFTLSGDGRYLLDDFTVTHNSWSAQSFMQRYDPDFKVYENTFFIYTQTLKFIQTKLTNNTSFIQDEEIKRGGTGSVSINDMVKNLELTAFRYKGVKSAWVFVEQKSHSVQSLFTSGKEHPIGPGKVDYFSQRVAIPYANSDEFIYIGDCIFDLPPEKQKKEYIQLKDDFVSRMLSSSGRGPEQDVMKDMEDTIKQINEKDTYVRWCNETYAGEPKALEKALFDHISSTYGINQSMTKLLIRRGAFTKK